MTSERSHILVVDDDRRLRQLLDQYLKDNGFLVQTAADVKQAEHLINNNHFDAMILDVMMPGESGLEFISRLRNTNSIDCNIYLPVLLLTAMGDTDDRIQGLEKGADDYLSKPFEPRELLLRLQTILRRLQPQRLPQPTLNLGEFTFDLERRALFNNNQPINLTTVEANLLAILGRSPGKPISREELARRGGVSLSPRTIDVQVTRLRKKIESNPHQPVYLKTVRHKGYILWPD